MGHVASGTTRWAVRGKGGAGRGVGDVGISHLKASARSLSLKASLVLFLGIVVAIGMWGAATSAAAGEARIQIGGGSEAQLGDEDLILIDGWQDDLSAWRNALQLEAVWERGHLESHVAVEMSPVPNGTLSLAAGIDGYLEGKEPFSTTVRKLSWRQEVDLGRHALGIEVGKSSRRLGRGRIDSLLMTGELPGFPLVGMSLEGPRYRYDKFAGDLGTADQPYKRLIVHRIAYDLTPEISVGFGEVSVRSEPHPGDLFYDLVPGLPLYLVKYFPGAASAKDNQLIYLDLELEAGPWVGYGELIVNEFPGGFGLSKNPPLYGLLVGIERGPWIAEYSHLTNYAYSNGDPGSVYSHDGRPLGHWMGGDGDALEIRWNGGVAPGWQLTLGGFLWRKGEGKVDSWFGSLKERQENAFLSGVVETTKGVVLGAARRVGDTGRLGDMTISGDVRAGVVANEHHKAGVTGVILTTRVGLSLAF